MAEPLLPYDLTPARPGSTRVHFDNSITVVTGYAVDEVGGFHALHASSLGGVVQCVTHGNECRVAPDIRDVTALAVAETDSSWWGGWRNGRQVARRQ